MRTGYLAIALILFISIVSPASADEGEAALREGLDAFRRNKYDISIPLFLKAREWYREHSMPKEEAMALCHAAEARCALNQTAEAISALKDALALLEPLDDSKSTVKVLNALCDLSMLRRDQDSARQYAEKALEGAEAIGDRENIIRALMSIGLLEQGAGNLKRALPLLERCCRLAREQGDEARLASALLSLGGVLSDLAEYDRAEAALQEALPLFEKHGLKFSVGVVYKNLGDLYRNRGDLVKALKCCEQALTIASGEKSRYLEADLYGRIASILDVRGEPEKALQYHEKSLALRKSLGDLPALTLSYNETGFYYWSRGNYSRALEYFDEAIRCAGESKNEAIRPTLLINRASVLDAMGRYEEAMRFFLEAREVVRDRGDRAREAAVLNSIGKVYFHLSDYKKALESFGKALSIEQSIGNRSCEAITLSNMGVVLSELSEYDRALECHQRALEIQKELGDRAGAAKTLNNLGQLYMQKAYRAQRLYKIYRLSKINEGALLYDKSSGFFDEAMNLARQVKNSSLEMTVESNLANIAIDRNQYDKAIPLLKSCTKRAEMSGDRSGEAFNTASLGFVYEKLGDTDRACEIYGKAIDTIESMASHYTVDEMKRKLFDGYNPIYVRLMNLLIRKGRYRDSFIYNERARTRSLMDMLDPVNIPARKKRGYGPNRNEQLILKERELRDRIAAMERTSSSMDEALRGKSIKDLIAEHVDVINQLWLSNQNYAQMVSVRPPSIEEIQKALPEDTALLEYFSGDEFTELWVITGKSFEHTAVWFNSNWVRMRVEMLRDSIAGYEYDRGDAKTDFRELSHELYQYLISPAADMLKGKRNLIIVPHGALYYLPFSALQSPDDRFLMEDHTITYAPSGSIWLLCRNAGKPGHEKLAAFASGGNVPYDAEPSMRSILRSASRSGDYLKDFPPLPGTLKEVEYITTLYKDKESYVEKDMTLANVRKATRDASVVHFATHGILNSSHPLFSGLLLRDTVLAIPDIFNLDLSAGLVILSGCNTALGEDSTGNELIGISRAFMYAGAPSVVATLWSISDDSSVMFMKEFHRHLREGKSKAESLREAQLTVKQNYPSPAHWAPFILIGDGSR